MGRRTLWTLTIAITFALIRVPTPLLAAECLAGPRTAGGIAFENVCAGAVDLLVDPAIDAEDVAALRSQVQADAVAVQAEFELSFETRPAIHVLATTGAYASALHALLGYPIATARWVADNSVAFFEPSVRAILVNWEAIRERRPIAAIRHELTHLITLRACAPRCDLVPAWLNEGQAHFAEAMVPGARWRALRMRFEAASMATTGTLLPLTTLVTQESWNSLVDWNGYYKYQEAARVTELLRADIGGAKPIASLYALIRRGQNVARAYESLTGRGFAIFVAELPERVRGDADAPGIATTEGTPTGAGASYLLYGFAAEAELTVSVSGRLFGSTQAVKVSPQGAWFGWLDEAVPPGTYTISAASPAVCVSVVVAKRGGVRAAIDPDVIGAGSRYRPCAHRSPRSGPS